jgi:hypothetical protein
MALEMRVYAELTQMDPKPLMGMTWRQLAAVTITAVVGGGISVGMFLLGWQEATAYVMAAIAIPLALYGWIKPMGLNIEVYLRHVLRAVRLGRLIYSNTAVWASHQTPSYEGKKHDTPTRPRRNTPVVEAGN